MNQRNKKVSTAPPWHVATAMPSWLASYGMPVSTRAKVATAPPWHVATAMPSWSTSHGAAVPTCHGTAVATLLINRPDIVRSYIRGRNEPSILHMAHIDGDRHELR